MKVLVESMTKEQFEGYFVNGKKDWGDQVDVYISHEEVEDLEGNKYCDVHFARVPKDEFTSVDEIKEKAMIQMFSDNEYLKKQNDNINANIETLSDAILDLTEE